MRYRFNAKPWLAVAVIGVFVAVTVLSLRVPPEPVYHGKPLSYWLQGYSIGGTTTPMSGRGKTAMIQDNVPDRFAAERAMEATGTNALPTLLRMIEYRAGPLKTRLLSLAGKIPFLRMQRANPLDPNYEALMAFKTLGTNAGPAVPQLIEIYNRESHRETKDWVLPVLAEIGPPAEPAIPMLLRTMSGTNVWLRENAARALGRIHADAPDAVPLLISCLNDPEPRLRQAAATALGDFGTNAKAAAPALRELIRDAKRSAGPNYGMRLPPGVKVHTLTVGEAARNALWNIGPDEESGHER